MAAHQLTQAPQKAFFPITSRSSPRSGRLSVLFYNIPYPRLPRLSRPAGAWERGARNPLFKHGANIARPHPGRTRMRRPRWPTPHNGGWASSPTQLCQLQDFVPNGMRAIRRPGWPPPTVAAPQLTQAPQKNHAPILPSPSRSTNDGGGWCAFSATSPGRADTPAPFWAAQLAPSALICCYLPGQSSYYRASMVLTVF